MEIQTLSKEQQLAKELMKLGSIAINEFGSIDLAIEKTQELNKTLEENQGLIKFMTDKKNIEMAQALINPMSIFKKKK